MEVSSFQHIKEFISMKLVNVAEVLPNKKIEEEINNTRELLAQLGPVFFAKILSVPSVTPLSDEDWVLMKKQLEMHFNVSMDNGILIQGKISNKEIRPGGRVKRNKQTKAITRRNTPSTLKSRSRREVIRTIDEDTDVVMNNIEDPDVERFSRYGMVVGHVQSGKTANYSALVCKAADAGYKFIVIIAGGINTLRNQTQERINEAFIGTNKGVPVGVGKLGGLDYVEAADQSDHFGARFQ